MSEFVTGDRDLDRKLREVGTRIADKAVAAGIRVALGEMRKAMRSEVSNPRVRKVIASRFKRKKKQGTTEAKVGAGVGKHKSAKQGSRGRGGKGISKQNAHWWFMGTAGRRLKGKGKYPAGTYRGRMPRSRAIVIGYVKSKPAAMAKLREKTLATIEKEVKKLR